MISLSLLILLTRLQMKHDHVQTRDEIAYRLIKILVLQLTLFLHPMTYPFFLLSANKLETFTSTKLPSTLYPCIYYFSYRVSLPFQHAKVIFTTTQSCSLLYSSKFNIKYS